MEFEVESAREVLRKTPQVLHAMLADLSDGWLKGREAPDAWSPYQVCGHLLHFEECDWIARPSVILTHGTMPVLALVAGEAGLGTNWYDAK